ncbi:flavin monoamine oxidase family protein [Salinithrix halophila]|uniref:Flavin monoamine oxidase family protein n=1 Tax=Salinithrix halophila TaxID=1485204 RepID=A0ABV8JGA6_9BACL
MSLYAPPPVPPAEMVQIIRNGLPPTPCPQTILIAGAGMAGLVSASLLKEAGHHVILFEASDRVGGRVFTMRSPFSEGLTFEVGAMRIPDTHYLVWEYIRKFRLPVNRFINETPSDILAVNGVLTRLKTYQQDPSILGFPVIPKERGETATQLFRSLMKKLIEGFHNNTHAMIQFLSRYSVDQILHQPPFGAPLSQGAIDMIKVILDTSGIMELSFIDVARLITILTDPEVQFYEITGGNDRLPASFLPQLKENLLLERKMTVILPERDKVTVQGVDQKTGQPFQLCGDRLIVTLPFSVLRMVDIVPVTAFSYEKRKAIRELHYTPASKVGIEFADRFWEENGSRGGRTITDLPIRFTYYPSHNSEPWNPAAVMASYTWGDDALLWNALDNPEAMELSLRNMASIFGPVVYEKFRRGISYSWSRSSYAAGGFAMFKPMQETELSHAIATPEGRVHFAGEHASTTRVWMQGAIESGVRVAKEVHESWMK